MSLFKVGMRRNNSDSLTPTTKCHPVDVIRSMFEKKKYIYKGRVLLDYILYRRTNYRQNLII